MAKNFIDAVKMWLSVSAALVSPVQLAASKTIETQIKSLKSYATSVHGLNLLLHTYPQKNPRERAGSLREFLGCTVATFPNVRPEPFLS